MHNTHCKSDATFSDGAKEEREGVVVIEEVKGKDDMYHFGHKYKNSRRIS